ncbi:actin-like protein 10 [Corapipo altera]|uniref:actin-like protein 10 n=1 Tax=Corapipo altera TaxID=415028 RepID=UPI000FD69575|nr:actin-like protein 10 [Corapipo altera]
MLKPAVIIDSGSSFTRGGFAGQRQPQFVLRTVLLHPCSSGPRRDSQQHPTAMGSMEGFAAAPRSCPLQHGIVEDWDGMKSLWGHLFSCSLRVPPEEHPVLLAESPSCPATDRVKAAEVLFESFGVPALHMANTGFLSLCAHGRVTGLAVEAGAGVSHVTTVCLGQTLRKGTQRLGVAGELLSSHLHRLLLESPNQPAALHALTRKTLSQLKKQCCYVSLDYERDLQDQGCHHPARFQTPDGHWITLGKERFCCPEPLFQPKLLQHGCPGLHQLAWQSLQTVPDHARRDVLGNIVLSGGSSMFPGFPERMCLGLNLLSQGTGVQIDVLASPERGTAAWLGGSMAASLTSFQRAWMTKGEYQEHGAEYVHTKFQ